MINKKLKFIFSNIGHVLPFFYLISTDHKTSVHTDIYIHLYVLYVYMWITTHFSMFVVTCCFVSFVNRLMIWLGLVFSVYNAQSESINICENAPSGSHISHTCNTCDRSSSVAPSSSVHNNRANRDTDIWSSCDKKKTHQLLSEHIREQ